MDDSWLTKRSVEGVNLDVPGSAPRVIKTWDERLSEDTVESGVDDEVGINIPHSLIASLKLQLILHIPFVSSLRLRTLLLLPPAPSHPHRSGRLRLYANLTHCPSFSDLDGLKSIMDLDISAPPPGYRRGPGGEREVEEWGLKVQRLANVHCVTLAFVSQARCVNRPRG